MEPTAQLLTPPAGSRPAALAACPRCDEPWPRVPAVATLLLDGLALHRCVRCGTRAGRSVEGARCVFTCEGCGVPFADPELLPRSAQRCPSCRDGVPPDYPDDDLAAAIGGEVRDALAGTWEFVGSPAATDYLARIARQVARRIDGASAAPRVVLFRELAARSLALPGDLVLLSTGLLASVGDEAELTFVIAHELAHAASGDAAVRLVRLGLRSMVHGSRRRRGGEAWSQAALDLVRLGYGRVREREADAVALHATIAAGYDPQAALRYLARIEERIVAGDADLAELAVSHPTPSYRTRKLEQALYGAERPGVVRVNREPFRRAVGHTVLARELVRIDPFADVAADARTGGSRLWVWLGLAGALAAAAVLGWVFFG